MSSWDLLFLAAGGVVGSAWLTAGAVVVTAGWWAIAAWPIGGLLVLVITAVMVEVSTQVPKTGGLTFLPLQTSGPLLATLVAAGVWAYYAASVASQVVAMVRAVATWSQWAVPLAGKNQRPTPQDIALGVFFLALITALNLLKPRQFLALNNVLTAFKIFVPLLIVVLLGCALIWHPSHVPSSSGAIQGGSLRSALGASVSSAVFYAYLGFQGPLEFAGNVRGGGVGEAARLRRAVYGTVLSSIFLYTALQGVNIYLEYHRLKPTAADPYVSIRFAGAVIGPHWLASAVTELISLDSVLSPAGTALVFTYVMTREVAALSRAHLTHRGLQQSKNSVIRLPAGFLQTVFGDDRLDVYWRILLVDFAITLLVLLGMRGNWAAISDIPTILALLVYATPGVVLASLRRREPALFPRRRYALLAPVSFAALAVVSVVSVAADTGVLWGIGMLAVFCLFLLGLPVAAPMARWYDARPHVHDFAALRTNAAAQLAAVLAGYFGLLTLAGIVGRRPWLPGGVAWRIAELTVVSAISLIAFQWLVRLSVRYMEANPPLLPKPLARRPSGERITGTRS